MKKFLKPTIPKIIIALLLLFASQYHTGGLFFSIFTLVVFFPFQKFVYFLSNSLVIWLALLVYSYILACIVLWIANYIKILKNSPGKNKSRLVALAILAVNIMVNALILRPIIISSDGFGAMIAWGVYLVLAIIAVIFQGWLINYLKPFRYNFLYFLGIVLVLGNMLLPILFGLFFAKP